MFMHPWYNQCLDYNSHLQGFIKASPPSRNFNDNLTCVPPDFSSAMQNVTNDNKEKYILKKNLIIFISVYSQVTTWYSIIQSY